MTKTLNKTSTLAFAAVAALSISAPLDEGKFAGIVTLPDGKHVAVILLANKPDERLSWGDAMAWAEGIDAQLPSRLMAALLFANLRPEFERTWHWTNETHEANESYAWYCNFGNGYQCGSGKSGEGSARAVRTIHLIG